jgi:hypothetical protein
MKRLIALSLFAATSALGQATNQQAGTAMLASGYTGNKYSYGFYGRNEAAGTGQSLWDGYGNYGTLGVAAANADVTEIGVLAIAAFGKHNIASIHRATSYKVDAFNIGQAVWAENRSSTGVATGKVVGSYIALSNLPFTRAELDADLTESAVQVLDNEEYVDAPILVARRDGAETFRLPGDAPLQIHDIGLTQPTCDAGRRGTFWIQASGTGNADRLEACLKRASDVFAWVAVALP